MTITQNAEKQAAMTPDMALALLTEGNQRFQENRRADRDLRQQVNETRTGQWPFATLLGCVDSRAPAELIFDLGIGDVFNARVAGNVVNEDLLGSIEFACKVAGSKLVVVLGHTHCGAVKGACDDVRLGNLTGLLAKLRPAVEQTSEPEAQQQRNSQNAAFVNAVALRNVELNVEAIREHSPVLRELEDEGTIRILGAMYDIETGAVEFLG